MIYILELSVKLLNINNLCGKNIEVVVFLELLDNP